MGIRADAGYPEEHAVEYSDGTQYISTSDMIVDGVAPALDRRWVVAAGALLLVWLAAMAWLARGSLARLDAVAVIEFLAAACIVPMLAGILWLLAMRTSRTEAHRFAGTARAMHEQAAFLERTVGAIGHTLDIHRVELTDQIVMLGTIGDTARERLARIGQDMADQVAQADAHAATLGGAVKTTLEGMGVILASLPHAREEIDAAARLLDATGLSAGQHAAALDAQLVALAERGRETDVVTGGAAQKLAAHIGRIEATSETAGARIEAITGSMSDAVDTLLGRTADAADEARKGIAAQGDAMLAMVDANHAALDHAARDGADALAARIASIETAIERVAAQLETQRSSGDRIVGDLDDGIARVQTRLTALHHQGIDRSQTLAASISALGGSADAMTEALRAGDAMATRTIGTTESLLIALDAATREIDETLPEALDRLDTRVAQSKAIVVQAKPELLALVTAASSTHDAIQAIADVVAEQRQTLDRLSGTLIETLNTGRAKADALGQLVDETIDSAHRFSDNAAPKLIETLLRVRDTAAAAADKARDTLARVIPEAANALEAASATAMRRATTDGVERQVRAITDASDAAVDATARAAERLAGQLHAITEQTAIVETRLEQARTEREDAGRDNLSRRVSLLIESLNSASIDIARVFAPDISDSAWAAYLKGDRGVFTRRAVRLLEPADARDIARFYDDDTGFREQVNRYIHDFEAMLRAILAQRDGSPLGVTILSSDMGKLYVALAQAIERLR